MKKAAPVCCFLVGVLALVSAFVMPNRVNPVAMATCLLAASLAFGFLSNSKD